METLSIQLSNLSEVSLRCGSDNPERDPLRRSHRLAASGRGIGNSVTTVAKQAFGPATRS
jgi:hypothetical protein